MMKFLLATNNKHKLQEMQDIIDRIIPGKIEIVLPKKILKEIPEIEENGATLEENSFLKASSFFKISQIPSIADDTGLEIECLNGQPGVYSARFAGIECDDKKNRAKVLDLMANIPAENRKACFRTVICLVDGWQVQLFEGKCCGRIIEEERGTNGFGYDSIFVPDGYSQTFAEIPAEMKNRLSHRANAVTKLMEYLKCGY